MLFPILKAFNFSPLNIRLVVVLLYMALLCEVCSFCSQSVKGFYHEGMLYFVKYFFSVC